MVVAFGGWVDAGEAATSALRSLVRQLAATPLATIDPEEFVDFTTIRPVVRLRMCLKMSAGFLITGTFWHTFCPPQRR
jgi:hypothetical protein